MLPWLQGNRLPARPIERRTLDLERGHFRHKHLQRGLDRYWPSLGLPIKRSIDWQGQRMAVGAYCKKRHQQVVECNVFQSTLSRFRKGGSMGQGYDLGMVRFCDGWMVLER